MTQPAGSHADAPSEPESIRNRGLPADALAWLQGHLWQRLMLFFCLYLLVLLAGEWLRLPAGSFACVSFSAGILMAACCLARGALWIWLLLLAAVAKALLWFIFDQSIAMVVHEYCWDVVVGLIGAAASKMGDHLFIQKGQNRRRWLMPLLGSVLGPLAAWGVNQLLGLSWDTSGAWHNPSGYLLVSGMLGVLAFYPLLLVAGDISPEDLRIRLRQGRLELAVCLFLVPVGVALAFYRNAGVGLSAGFLLALPLLLCGLRFGPVGASLGGLLYLVSLSMACCFQTDIQDDQSLVGLQFVSLLVLATAQYAAHLVETQRRAARKLMGLHDSTTELVVSCELVRNAVGLAVDIRFLDVNPAFTLITGYSREVALSTTAAKLYGTEHPPHLAELDLMIRNGRPAAFDTYLPKARRYLKATAFPTDNRSAFTLVATDVTQHLEREAEASRISRMYAVLLQINQVIVRAHDLEGLLRGVANAFVAQGGAGFCCVVWRDTLGAPARAMAHAGTVGDALGGLEGIGGGQRSDGMLAELAMREGRTAVCNDFLMDSMAKTWAEAASRSGFRSAAAFPLRFSGVICGAFCLYSKEARAFSTKELTLLTTASVDISHALDNQQKDAARLQAVSELQESEHRSSHAV